MGIMYYVTHEYKEKWSMTWKLMLLTVLSFLILMISSLMIGSFNGFLIFLGVLLSIGVSILVSFLGQKIILNTFVPKHIPGFKISLGQTIKKTLALMTIVIGVVFVFEILLFIVAGIAAGLSSIFFGIIAVILIIGLFIVMATLTLIAFYAVLEDLKNSNYSYRSTFKTFWKLKDTHMKKAFITILKMLVLLLIAAIVLVLIYMLLFFIIIAIVAATQSILMLMVLLIVMWLVLIIAYIMLSAMMIQYSIASYLA